MMRSFLFLMFLIHQAIANDLSLMNPQAQGDTLDSSGVFLPVDLLTETPSNQFATPTWSSEKISNSEPGLGPILSPFAALASGCNNRIGNSQEQTFTPSRFRRSLAGINKRRIPDFCNFQPTDRPVVAPQKLEEGTSDPSTPSPETPHPGVPGKSNSAPSVGPSKGPASNEEIRALIYSLPGINGEPNPAACDILLKPLHKVPICVPPHPARDSVAEILSPARLWALDDRCHWWTEECWCCVMARESYYFGESRPSAYPATGFDCILVHGTDSDP